MRARTARDERADLARCDRGRGARRAASPGSARRQLELDAARASGCARWPGSGGEREVAVERRARCARRAPAIGIDGRRDQIDGRERLGAPAPRSRGSRSRPRRRRRAPACHRDRDRSSPRRSAPRVEREPRDEPAAARPARCGRCRRRSRARAGTPCRRTGRRGGRAAARARRAPRRRERERAASTTRQPSRVARRLGACARRAPLLGPAHARGDERAVGVDLDRRSRARPAASPRRNRSVSSRRSVHAGVRPRLGLDRGADARAAEPDRVVARLRSRGELAGRVGDARGRAAWRTRSENDDDERRARK